MAGPTTGARTENGIASILLKLKRVSLTAVAFDCEFSGCKLPAEVDRPEDTPAEAIEKKCRVAEYFDVLQWGITLVENVQGKCRLCTYSFYVTAPQGARTKWCTKAQDFLEKHSFDFEQHKRQGLPYMTRGCEGALRFLGKDIPKHQTSLLHVWKAIVDRRLPVVLHGPLDLLFLLRSFEVSPLPRGRELSNLVGRCFDRVYDLAHISCKHGEPTYRVDLGCCMGLWDFLCLTRNRTPYMTVLEGASDQQRHDAGDDAAATAEAFVRAQAWMQEVVEEAANVLFLYKHADGFRLELPGVDANGTANVDVRELVPAAARAEGGRRIRAQPPQPAMRTAAQQWLAGGARSCNVDWLTSWAWLGDCPSTCSGSPLASHTEPGSSPGGAGHCFALEKDPGSIMPSSRAWSSSSAASSDGEDTWPHVRLQHSDFSGPSRAADPSDSDGSSSGVEADSGSPCNSEERLSVWCSEALEVLYWPPTAPPGDWTCNRDAEIRVPLSIDGEAWSPLAFSNLCKAWAEGYIGPTADLPSPTLRQASATTQYQ